jgi:SAM-dependent methyltransferase
MAQPVQHPHPQADALHAQAWADMRELLDLQLSPPGLRAIEALDPRPTETIVDIGCGAGQTVLQLAQRVGPEGQVTGVDISPLLLKLARQRAEGLSQACFVECDAAKLDLPEHSVDGFFSRFGVMAFVDPAAVFSNFHRMIKPSGRLAFVCWRSLGENELDLLPLQAAGLEAMLDPTPYSFEDADYLRATLQKAGFQQIDVAAHNELVSSGDLDAMAKVLLRVGPLGKILRESPGLRLDAEPRLRKALRAREARSSVALMAATWIVTARA